MMHRLVVKKALTPPVATKKTEEKSLAPPHQNTWKISIISNCRSNIQLIDNANILEVIKI